ncbi:MAG: hypothetical protein AAGD25_14705 [Cyanobacteria bacterium P01_F01_bin.150]
MSFYPEPVEGLSFTLFPVSRWECPPETLAQVRQRSQSLLKGTQPESGHQESGPGGVEAAGLGRRWGGSVPLLGGARVGSSAFCLLPSALTRDSSLLNHS